MAAKVPGYTKGMGIAMMMEHPLPTREVVIAKRSLTDNPPISVFHQEMYWLERLGMHDRFIALTDFTVQRLDAAYRKLSG
jgi:hypothetical protein